MPGFWRADGFEEDASCGEGCTKLDDIHDALALFRDKPESCGDETGGDVGKDIEGPGEHRPEEDLGCESF